MKKPTLTVSLKLSSESGGDVFTFLELDRAPTFSELKLLGQIQESMNILPTRTKTRITICRSTV